MRNIAIRASFQKSSSIMINVFSNLHQISGAGARYKSEKFVAVWDNRFLENVKLCSERIPGECTEKNPTNFQEVENKFYISRCIDK